MVETKGSDELDYRRDGDAWLEGEESVPLVPVRRKNMTPNSKPEGKALRCQWVVIEAGNSQLAAWGV